MSAIRGFALVLAGGEGKRLWPLTADRAKPAVPFGGNYRLIDFALSNLVNGGSGGSPSSPSTRATASTATLATTWSLSPLLGNYVAPVPAQMRRGPRWFAGSADAIYQSLNLIYDERPDYILVFGADHIYRTDPRQMIAQHLECGAGLTVAGHSGPVGAGRPVRGDRDRRRRAHDQGVPREAGRGHRAPRRVRHGAGLDGQLRLRREGARSTSSTADAEDESSTHDIGRDIIPRLVAERRRPGLGFRREPGPGVSEREHGYWRDIGTLDAYYDAHMDLISADPVFNLYNEHWPILSCTSRCRRRSSSTGAGAHRDGARLDGLRGVVVSGGVVRRSVLSPGVRVHSRRGRGLRAAHGVDVGRGAIVRNAISTRGPDRSRRPDRRRPEADRALSRFARRDRRDRQGRDVDALSRRVALLTREYPPEVYGGAGSTSSTSPASSPRLVEVTVHAWGAERPPGPAGRPSSPTGPGRARGPRAVPRPPSRRSRSTCDGGRARRRRLVHSHTWYTNLAGHLSRLSHGIPHVATVHSLEPMRPGRPSSSAAATPSPLRRAHGTRRRRRRSSRSRRRCAATCCAATRSSTRGGSR